MALFDRGVDVCQQLDHLFVDAPDLMDLGAGPRSKDVFAHFLLGDLRVKLMEIDNRRDVVFNVSGKYFFDAAHHRSC